MRKLILILIATLLVASLLFADSYNENPIKDTWIWPGYGPHGDSNELRVNRISQHDQEVVLEWDLSSIPAGSTINSAEVYVYNYDEFGGTLNAEIYRVTESWDEDTLVDEIDHDDANPYDNVDISGSGSYKTFDITTLVQEWIDGTYDNYGVVYYGISGSGYFIRFYSREASSDNPYLEIDYTQTSIQPTSLGNIKSLFE